MNEDINFEYGFYVEFYTDLKGLPYKDALEHWNHCGKQEGRYPNAEALYNKYGVSIDELPHDFDFDTYFAVNPDVERTNKYFGILHYLKWGKPEGRPYKAGQKASADIQHPAKPETVPAPAAFSTIAEPAEPEPLQPAPAADTPDIWRPTTPDALLIATEFDQAFYVLQNPDIAEAGIDPLRHFINSGWKEWRDPSPDFSIAHYLKTYSDIRDKQVNPFFHYLLIGRKEGRQPKPPATPASNITSSQPSRPPANPVDNEKEVVAGEFDREFYLRQNPDIASAGVDPLEHFMAAGWKEQRDPNPEFSIKFYLSSYADVRNRGINPFFHFINSGRSEGRKAKAAPPPPVETHVEAVVISFDPPAPIIDNDSEYAVIAREFDHAFYLERNRDIAEGGMDPLQHFVESGWREHRDPHPEFSIEFYLNQYNDIRDRNINPFYHYISAGRAEGRSPNPAHYQQFRATVNTLDAEAPTVAASSNDPSSMISAEFDAVFYLERNQDIAEAGLDPLEHFMSSGWKEHRDPHPEFSIEFYLNQYEDIRDQNINPFFHYLSAGRNEGRSPNPAHFQQSRATTSTPDTAGLPAEAINEEHKGVVSTEFDAVFYLEQNQDIAGAGLDPLDHFMLAGWKERRDPNPDFSIEYYLDNNADIRDAGINPFWHFLIGGRREGRTAASFSHRKRRQVYTPKVSVIVPNYNHAKFLPKRIDCILEQTYGIDRIELLLLDDVSSDNSVEVINSYAEKYPDTVRPIINEKNSGGVFNQWQKGIEAATGELIWICESDDFCELDFLEKIIPTFADESIMIGFGRIQFADGKGNFMEGLDGYREQSEPGIWGQTTVRSASHWFRTAFGVSNIIPNVGGCVFRKQPVATGTWDEAKRYKILGDWYLYAVLSGGGRMAFVPEAVTYFRQHGNNTSVKSFQTAYYYEEHKRIIDYLRERWGTPDTIALRFFSKVYEQFEYAKVRSKIGDLTAIFNIEDTLKKKKTATHILICSLGFHLGGGEIFPIHLANELVKRDFIVSFMVLDPNNIEEKIRKQLDGRIAVYEAQLVKEIGPERFLQEAGVDLIHSHVIGIEFFFFGTGRPKLDMPYVITLHGSYEVTPLSDDMLFRLVRDVSHWVFLSPKNLGHLKDVPITKDRLTYIANGMPIDTRPFPHTREEMGIGPDDVVFTLVSRAIPQKGWRPAAMAITAAQKLTTRKLFLLLCGSGPEEDAIKEEFGDNPAIKVLGFQERIHGVYKLTDCAILPTRFLGESFPLTLIQAMQVGAPIIATDVGEIKKMVYANGLEAGLTIEWSEDDETFVNGLTEAMLAMTDDNFRKARSDDAHKLGQDYEIEVVTDKYVQIFNIELNKKLS